jgi:hypothetical protein
MNRLIQTGASRFTEIAGEADMMTTNGLASANDRHPEIGGMGQQGRRYDFPPASFDTSDRILCPSRFAHRHLTPLRHRPPDYYDESLRNRRYRAGSLRLYREQTVPAASNGNKNDQLALTADSYSEGLSTYDE